MTKQRFFVPSSKLATAAYLMFLSVTFVRTFVEQNMKRFHNKLLALFLASMVIQLGCIKENTAYQTEPTTIKIAQAQTRLISVVLSTRVEVEQKTGESKFGRLTGIDPKGNSLTITLDNQRLESIPTDKINKVRFLLGDQQCPKRNENFVCPTRNYPLPPALGEIRKWSNIALGDLTLTENNNRVDVKLPCEVDRRACKEKGASYAISEITFTAKNQVTLLVDVSN